MTNPAIREKRLTRDQAILRGREAAHRNAWGDVYSFLTGAEEMAGAEQAMLDPAALRKMVADASEKLYLPTPPLFCPLLTMPAVTKSVPLLLRSMV